MLVRASEGDGEEYYRYLVRIRQGSYIALDKTEDTYTKHYCNKVDSSNC